ncbi:MAG TPA: DUF6356 family protein [Microvirga sp.]|jgi:hypothetical protein|nr:DUF6356 family protein [Microvirga sp.]
MTLKRLFTDHPEAVGESYFEHMRVALSFAGPLAYGAFAALVHAFLPFFFVTTASRTVKDLYARMTNRVPKAPIRRAETAPANGMPAWDPVI